MEYRKLYQYFMVICTIAIVISGAIIFMMLCPDTDGLSGWGALRFDSGGVPPSWKCFYGGNSSMKVQNCQMQPGTALTYETWMEVNSQLLNALFTVIAFVNHPSRFCELYLLLKGNNDVLNAAFPSRSIFNYSERLFILVLLNMNCFGQYPIAIAHWCFQNYHRPGWVVPIFLPVCFCSQSLAAFLEYRWKKGRDIDPSGVEIKMNDMRWLK